MRRQTLEQSPSRLPTAVLGFNSDMESARGVLAEDLPDATHIFGNPTVSGPGTQIVGA